jgi:TP901 family phage tail tape measure protein
MSGLLSGIKAGATQALGFGAAAIGAAAIAKLVTTFGDAVTNAREFGVEISKINSTLPNGIRLTKQQEQALIDLGDAYGRTGAQEAAAYFEIISNGVEDTAVASDILKASNEAALAGITSLDSAARLITTTFNAYSRQGATATEITDSLVVATQLSGVKFEDLASSLGRVPALAANSNISIGELSGTVAFLNKNSLTTEQAITGVRGILNAIIKPSEEATQIARRLGIEFSSTALESKGLVKFLAEVSKATGNNSTTLSRLFGDINAINAVIAISKGGFDSFKDSVDRATNSSGAAAKASNIACRAVGEWGGQAQTL